MATSFSSLIAELQPYARALVDAAGSAGLLPRVTSTYRSRADQERLYRRYLAGMQPYYVAPPGTSPHEYGYAFDLVVSPMGALGDVGALWETWGGYWGGRQNDPVHFQYPGFEQWFRSAYGTTPHELAAVGGIDTLAQVRKVVTEISPYGEFGVEGNPFLAFPEYIASLFGR